MFHRKTSVFSGSSLAQERSNLFCLFVCFILRFLSVILYRKGIFFYTRVCAFGDAAIELLLLLWQAEAARSRREDGGGGMRRVTDGRRLRTTVSAHHVVFPCPPTPPPPPSNPPQPSSPSVCLCSTFWPHSVPAVAFFLSLCLPSVVVSHRRSLSPLLSPLSRTFTRPCLFQQLLPPLRRCCTCSAEAVGGSNWVAVLLCLHQCD